jgi:beta-galactosidase
VFDGRLPGLLAELCGLEVEEYDSLSHDMHNELQFTPAELGDGSPLPVGIWCDVLQPRGAAVVARYTRDYYAGKAAITLNRIDATPGGRPGQVVYVGALGDEHLYERLAGWLLDLAGVQPILAAPPGVEVAERWRGNQRLLFLLNHSGETQEVVLGGRYTNLLDGSGPIQDAVSLASHEVAVLVGEHPEF